MALSPKHAAWVRTAVDYGSMTAFLGTLLISHDFLLATWVLMGASIVALGLGWFAERRLAPIPLLAGGTALVFGTLTLVFHDKSFVQMKLTFVDGVLTAVLLGGVILKRNPLKALIGSSLVLPDEAWRTLSIRYALFFFASAVANEIARRQLSSEHWGMFRFAVLGAALIFSFAQTPFLMKHMAAHTDEPVAVEPPDPGF